MDTYSPKDLRDIYNSLPEDLQVAIFSPETMDIYNQIQARYALDPAQREELSIQTGLLMMGITEPKEYVLVLAERLGIMRDKAAFIAQEVNRNILHGVRESLKEVHTPIEEQMTPVVASNIPTVPPTVPTPSMPPSTLNQKLGATFRVSTAPQASVPNYGVPTSPVPPPVPNAPIPAEPTPVSQAPRAANDPYREAVL